MDTIMSFLKDIDMAALVMIVLFGIPFIAMIVYAIVLHRRGKRMGVTYDIPKEIDNEFWEPADRDLFLDPMYDGMPGSLSDYADNDPQNPEYSYH
ncbi:MAG: hypothetical protein JRD93_17185 [Deltaproteobacteria bacterium]|nr:hypothetical protein [Deltaproteobacteria bacterium]MBW2663660.1 hypothetical protein [Deltaproteobacteria bacterium]